jgi:hypothetical protein
MSARATEPVSFGVGFFVLGELFDCLCIDGAWRGLGGSRE